MDSRTSNQQIASFVTPEELCKVLCSSRRTLRYWIQKGVLPEPFRLGPDGRLLRWHAADIVDYLARTWGVRTDDGGLTVWAVLAAPAHSRQPASPDLPQQVDAGGNSR